MTDEKIIQQMEEGTKDEDVYSEEGQEQLVADDEITDIEEGIMQGYNQDEATCANCNKVLIDENIVEEDLEGKHFRFCCEDCARNFEVREDH